MPSPNGYVEFETLAKGVKSAYEITGAPPGQMPTDSEFDKVKLALKDLRVSAHEMSGAYQDIKPEFVSTLSEYSERDGDRGRFQVLALVLPRAGERPRPVPGEERRPPAG